jgi:hypothetical protein
MQIRKAHSAQNYRFALARCLSGEIKTTIANLSISLAAAHHGVNEQHSPALLSDLGRFIFPIVQDNP